MAMLGSKLKIDGMTLSSTALVPHATYLQIFTCFTRQTFLTYSPSFSLSYPWWTLKAPVSIVWEVAMLLSFGSSFHDYHCQVFTCKVKFTLRLRLTYYSCMVVRCTVCLRIQCLVFFFGPFVCYTLSRFSTFK
jgi:hypothetical protein